MLNAILRRARLAWLKFRGLRTAGRAWVQQVDIPRHPGRIQLGDGAALDRGVTLLVSGDNRDLAIQIGRGTYVNRHTMIDASCSVELGSDCMIGPFVYITDHDHGMAPESLIKDQSLIESSVAIGDDVWIGAHASILKGVTIGEGAVVAAGAVVTRSVDPYTIVGGVPAKVLGHRKEQKNG